MENTQNYIEEDEIDLKELFNTIWNNKFQIAIFTFVVTSLTIVYTLSIPNSYKSTTSLVPHAQAKSSLGGLGALAGMAGIDIGGGGGVDAVTSFTTILNDFSFQNRVIQKYDLSQKLIPNEKNLVFALGYDGIYNIFHSKSTEKDERSKEEITYDTYKVLIKIITISSDKKSGVITLSVESIDRFLAKELVDIYLVELTTHLRTIEMQDVDKQIKYYNAELENTDELSMKDQLGKLATGLVQKKVLSMANEFYNVKQMTKSQVAYIKEKSKPKRGLIVVVSFVTSIILAIFLTFFMEFIRKDEDNNNL
ncbi:MAG: hypothetical protein KAJ49_09215 [Arcobacteraceae bacterium]|nr:hypothetical protein [Arcobacteraceae bacterium]